MTKSDTVPEPVENTELTAEREVGVKTTRRGRKPTSDEEYFAASQAKIDKY